MTQEEHLAKKKWLNRAHLAERNVQILRERLEHDRSRAERISRSGCCTGSGSRGNPTEDSLLRVAETEELLREAKRECQRIRSEISAAIRSVPDPTERRILQMHFLEFRSFSEIAHILHYSRRTVLRRYGIALEKVPTFPKRLTDTT